MTKVILNKWNGGQAEDLRTREFDKHEYSLNFNSSNEKHRLFAYANSIEETLATSTMDEVEISDVTTCRIAGNNVLVGAGYQNGSANSLTFWIKNNLTDVWQPQASASGNSYIKGTLISYKSQAYAVDSNGSGTFRLIKYISAGNVQTVGTITASISSNVKCIVHPEDNILYVVVGNVIAKWDNTTFSTASSILPSEFNICSLAVYSSYIAIGMNTISDSNNPICLLWGRDITNNLLQGSIDLGEGYLGIVENLHNNLFFIMSSGNKFSTTLQNKLIIKGYAGGSVENVVEMSISTNLNFVLSVKAKKNNRVYFAFRNSDCIWSFGKNRDGEYTVQQENYIKNGEKISGLTYAQMIYGISIIGDIIWIGFTSQTGIYSLYRSNNNLGSVYFGATSIYKTTINPNMPEYDRTQLKTLKFIKVHYTGSSTGSIAIEYSVDGNEMKEIFNQVNTTGEKVVKSLHQTDSKPFLSGYEFQFQFKVSGDAKIKSLEYIYETIKNEI